MTTGKVGESPAPAWNVQYRFTLKGILGRGKGAVATAEREKRGIHTLPGSLHDAILLTGKSDIVRRALGDHVFNAFLKNKQIEWDQYRSCVTEFELDRYLSIL